MTTTQSFSRRTRVRGYQNVSILDYIAAEDDGVVVTTEAIRCAKLQSNITTNKPTPSLLQDGCPSCHPMHSLRALNEKVTFYGLAHPNHIWGLLTLSPTTKGSWLPWRRVNKPLISPLTPVPTHKTLHRPLQKS